MYRNYLKWCEEFKPAECDDDMFYEQLAKGKFYFLSMDERHPILYFVGREHEADRDNYKDVLKIWLLCL